MIIHRINRWSIQKHTPADKTFAIYGPDIALSVDYDDVNHETVDKVAEQIVKVLNEHFNGGGHPYK